MAGSPKKRSIRARARAVQLSADVDLSQSIHARMVKLLREGLYLPQACAIAGIPIGTANRWMAEGKRDPDSKAGAFRRSVLAARAFVVRKLIVAAIDAATVPDDKGHTDGRLALDLAKRYDPKHYADAATKVELSGKGGAPLVQVFLPEMIPVLPALGAALVAAEPTRELPPPTDEPKGSS